jgi:putative transposase
MKRLSRNDRVAVLHYVTINVREKARAFAADAYARAAVYALREYCDRHPARLVAYVVMPTHMHAIINPRDGHINRFLAQYKPGVTMAVQALAQQANADRVLEWLIDADGRADLWQNGKHNLHLWSARLIWQKIDYLHNNPIRAGIVQHAGAYPYSSFRAMYQTGDEVLVPIDREFWWEEDLHLEDDEGVR